MNYKMFKVNRLLFVVVILLLSTKVLSIELVSKNASIFEQALKQQVLMAGVELLLVVDEEERVISPTYQLKSGDRIRLRIRTSLDSEYRLYLLDKQGQKVKSLFLKGQTSAAATTLVPSLLEGILELDSKPGTEWLQLVITGKNGEPSTPKQNALRQKHPHGKIEQIILRNIKLLAPPAQKVQYDPISQTIYFSQQKPDKGLNEISLKLGLSHQ